VADVKAASAAGVIFVEISQLAALASYCVGEIIRSMRQSAAAEAELSQ